MSPDERPPVYWQCWYLDRLARLVYLRREYLLMCRHEDKPPEDDRVRLLNAGEHSLYLACLRAGCDMGAVERMIEEASAGE